MIFENDEDYASESPDYALRIHVSPVGDTQRDIRRSLRWINYVVRQLKELGVRAQNGNFYTIYPLRLYPRTLIVDILDNEYKNKRIDLLKAYAVSKSSAYALIRTLPQNSSRRCAMKLVHLRAFLDSRDFIFFHLNRCMDFVERLLFLRNCREEISSVERRISTRNSYENFLVGQPRDLCSSDGSLYHSYRQHQKLQSKLSRLREIECFTAQLFRHEFPHGRAASSSEKVKKC